ncbi:MAG: Re/Si-specific NAD(P)(+) transhydrogenase subunit alpha [Deltaproteobacteria bacterium]
MKVGIPKEIYPNERRVAASPTTVQKLRKLGLDVVIQSGAGDAATYTDAAFIEVGATIAHDATSLWEQADIVLKVRPPMHNAELDKHEADLLKEGARLIGFIWPAQGKALMDRLAARKATVLAMDSMPRITRAQKMDALSAMGNIAGYRAVLEAVSHFGRFVPGQMTAAGRVKPATVLIIGAGVAGLAAIAAARSLGAVVKAFDTRPAVREQVESLGAQFLEFKFDESGEGEGGYAKSMSAAYIAAEQAMISLHAKESDIIVTTALVPGQPAPKLITSGAVVSMHPGSVIVDLAAEQGGNCALTKPDEIVERFGVIIVGITDVPSRMAQQSTDLYATTVYNLLEELITKEQTFVINMEDEAQRGATVIKDGEITWPPPKRPPLRTGGPKAEADKPKAPPPKPKSNTGAVLGLVAALALGGLGMVAPGPFMAHLTVFLLAVVVGWHVVWNVSAALHTPLMSVTNAISGIIVIGGMLLVSGAGAGSVLAAVAVLLASINVAGGFLVTQRMLRMFRK